MKKHSIKACLSILLLVFSLGGCVIRYDYSYQTPPHGKPVEHVLSQFDSTTHQTLWIVPRSKEQYFNQKINKMIEKRRSPNFSEGVVTLLPTTTTDLWLEVGVSNPLNKEFTVMLYTYKNGMDHDPEIEVIFNGEEEEWEENIILALESPKPIEVWLGNKKTFLFLGPYEWKLEKNTTNGGKS